MAGADWHGPSGLGMAALGKLRLGRNGTARDGSARRGGTRQARMAPAALGWARYAVASFGTAGLASHGARSRARRGRSRRGEAGLDWPVSASHGVARQQWHGIAWSAPARLVAVGRRLARQDWHAMVSMGTPRPALAGQAWTAMVRPAGASHGPVGLGTAAMATSSHGCRDHAHGRRGSQPARPGHGREAAQNDHPRTAHPARRMAAPWRPRTPRRTLRRSRDIQASQRSRTMASHSCSRR